MYLCDKTITYLKNYFSFIIFDNTWPITNQYKGEKIQLKTYHNVISIKSYINANRNH